jgi:hypothetical protein
MVLPPTSDFISISRYGLMSFGSLSSVTLQMMSQLRSAGCNITLEKRTQAAGISASTTGAPVMPRTTRSCRRLHKRPEGGNTCYQQYSGQSVPGIIHGKYLIPLFILFYPVCNDLTCLPEPLRFRTVARGPASIAGTPRTTNSGLLTIRYPLYKWYQRE